MVASRSQDPRLDDRPRDLYFKAEDYLSGPKPLGDRDLTVIRNQRFNLFRQVNQKIEDLTAALKSVKAFDRTGNICAAVGNAVDVHDDLQRLFRHLIADVRAADTRYEAGISTERLTDAAAAPASASDAGSWLSARDPEFDRGVTPKPGPGLMSIQITEMHDVDAVRSNINAALDHAGRNRAGA